MALQRAFCLNLGADVECHVGFRTDEASTEAYNPPVQQADPALPLRKLRLIKKPRLAARWSTGVQPVSTASTAQELKALSLNLAECQACQGRWFALMCAGDAVRRFLAPRLITTVVVVTAVAVCATLAAFA